jgi:hypothetical protein
LIAACTDALAFAEGFYHRSYLPVARVPVVYAALVGVSNMSVLVAAAEFLCERAEVGEPRLHTCQMVAERVAAEALDVTLIAGADYLCMACTWLEKRSRDGPCTCLVEVLEGSHESAEMNASGYDQETEDESAGSLLDTGHCVGSGAMESLAALEEESETHRGV